MKLAMQLLELIPQVCIQSQTDSAETECTDGDLSTEFLTFLQEQKKKQKYSLLSPTHLSLVHIVIRFKLQSGCFVTGQSLDCIYIFINMYLTLHGGQGSLKWLVEAGALPEEFTDDEESEIIPQPAPPRKQQAAAAAAAAAAAPVPIVKKGHDVKVFEVRHHKALNATG